MREITTRDALGRATVGSAKLDQSNTDMCATPWRIGCVVGY